MPVAFNNSAAHNANSGPATSVSVNYTVGSGADRLLLVQSASSASTSAITFAGAALTAVGSLTGSLRTWRKTNPASGSQPLVFTVSAYSNLMASMADFSGVDQTTPLGAQVSNSNAGSVASTGSITVLSGGAAWGGMISAYASAGSVTANQGTLASSTQVSGIIKAGAYRLNTGNLAWNLPSSPTWWAQGFPINGTVQSDLSGNGVISSFDASGSLISVSSSLLGDAVLGSFDASGVLQTQPGTITSPIFRNWSGTALPNTTIPKVMVVRISDMVTVLNLTNQVTDGGGVLTIASALLLPGVPYLLITCNADGTATGCEPVTAA